MNKEEVLKEAIIKIEQKDNDNAINLLEEIIKFDENFEDAYFYLGDVYNNIQQYGKAINCYNKVLDLNPERVEAKTKVNMLKSIFDFYNKDIYNP